MKEKKKREMPQLRRCVKVEVAVLDSPSLVDLMVSVDVNQDLNRNGLDCT